VYDVRAAKEKGTIKVGRRPGASNGGKDWWGRSVGEVPRGTKNSYREGKFAIKRDPSPGVGVVVLGREGRCGGWGGRKRCNYIARGSSNYHVGGFWRGSRQQSQKKPQNLEPFRERSQKGGQVNPQGWKI